MMEKSISVSENKTRCRLWVGPLTPHSYSKNKAEKYTSEKGWKLDIDNIPEEYKTDIKQKLATINLQRGNSQEIWKALKDTFKVIANKNIQRKEKKNRPTWMSQDTLRVVDNR
jgi:hypothetical protein